MDGKVDTVRNETHPTALLAERLGGNLVTCGEDDSRLEVRFGEFVRVSGTPTRLQVSQMSALTPTMNHESV